MKHLILASIFCLAFAITLSAQAPIKVVPQIIPLPPNIGVWSVVQGMKTPVLLAPRELKVRRSGAPGGVCSVPLLEAHASANDPGIAATPRDNSVPIPQARVPAPPCK